MHNTKSTKPNGHAKKETLTLKREKNVGGQTENKPLKKKQTSILKRKEGKDDTPQIGMI